MCQSKKETHFTSENRCTQLCRPLTYVGLLNNMVKHYTHLVIILQYNVYIYIRPERNYICRQFCILYFYSITNERLSMQLMQFQLFTRNFVIKTTMKYKEQEMSFCSFLSFVRIIIWFLFSYKNKNYNYNLLDVQIL